MFYLIFLLLLIAILLLVAVASMNDNDDETSTNTSPKVKPVDNSVFAGKYIAGHPDFDDPIDDVRIDIIGDNISIFSKGKVLPYILIPHRSIKNIAFEDETTIQKRVGLKRMIALGIFAFAVKKKVRNELAYVVIEWNDGRFDHETTFEFEGHGAIHSANKLRNNIIKRLRAIEAAETDLQTKMAIEINLERSQPSLLEERQEKES